MNAPVSYNRAERTFRDAYLACALWSSIDDSGKPLDNGALEFAPGVALALVNEGLKFYEAHWEDVSDDPAQAGHDLWLTRNRHGAGFWDGDWTEAVGKRLTDASHAMGGIDLYIGDDGMIHALGAVNA